MYDKEQETVIFNFPNTLPRGFAQLSLKFTGELNDKMKGFYRSKYTTQAGEEKHMGVTQFEVNIFVKTSLKEFKMTCIYSHACSLSYITLPCFHNSSLF